MFLCWLALSMGFDLSWLWNCSGSNHNCGLLEGLQYLQTLVCWCQMQHQVGFLARDNNLYPWISMMYPWSLCGCSNLQTCRDDDSARRLIDGRRYFFGRWCGSGICERHLTEQLELCCLWPRVRYNLHLILDKLWEGFIYVALKRAPIWSYLTYLYSSSQSMDLVGEGPCERVVVFGFVSLETEREALVFSMYFPIFIIVSSSGKVSQYRWTNSFMSWSWWKRMKTLQSYPVLYS